LLAFAHAVAMLVPAARGQWSVAEQHLGAAQRAAAASGDAPSHCFADNAAVHLAACRGDADAVVRSAQWLLTDGPGGTHEPGFYSWPVNYVAALVTLRRFDEASTELARLELLAHQRQRRSRQAALARVRGELAAAQRDTASARGAFRQAVRLGDGAVDALEAAIARAAYGRFLRRRGERRAAIEQLGDARQIFASLRAEPFLRRVESELKACGSRVRANAQPAQTSLTHQELAVARLVCAGLTNRGVADELVLSVKTVEYHLGHVYTKLGIRSRTELVNQLRMTNLASET